MTSALFKQYFVNWDKQLGEDGRKVVAVVDNCSAHPKAVADSLLNIKLIFLPPNCTSVIQPLDRGIIKNIKHYYREELVQKKIRVIDGEETAEIHVLGAMEILASSWNKVTSQTISNCFSNAGWKRTENNLPNFENGPDSDEYVGIDDDVATTGDLTDAEILQIVTGESTQPVSEDEESLEQNNPNDTNSSNDPTGGIMIDLQNFLRNSENVDPETLQLFNALKQKLEA